MITIETPIQKRFSDVDSFLHVNNVSQQMYFDIGKMEFYRQVLEIDTPEKIRRIITVATETSYRGQIRMEDDIILRTTIDKVGNTSMQFFQQLICRMADGSEEVKTESRSVMVVFDFQKQEKAAVPDSWRKILTQ
ncbi:MAG: thioesterase family protein [Alistipes sp.]|nr:thioesterase family protein [Alistipes sp.]